MPLHRYSRALVAVLAAAGGTRAAAGKVLPERVPEAEWRYLDPAALGAESRDTPVLQEHLRRPWADAQRRLKSNPGAHLVATAPDIWVVPDVITSDAADKLLEFVNDGYSKPNDFERAWCFQVSAFHLRERFPNEQIELDSDGNECTRNQTFGAQLAAEKGHVTVSKSWMIANGESKAADAIGRTIEEDVGLKLGLAYVTQVLEYPEHGAYSEHEDCRPDGKQAGEAERGGTALIYLSDADGGETCFPRRGICVRPRKGAGVFFQSLDAQGNCDPLSQHVAQEVTGAKKVVLQRWYLDTYSVPQGVNADTIHCDRGSNCRNYIANPAREMAARLSREAGTLLQENQDMEGALSKFNEAILVYPHYAWAEAKVGGLILQQAEGEEGPMKFAQTTVAEEHLRNALVEAPFFADVHYYLGTIEKDRKEWAKAAEHFSILVEFSEGDDEGWMNLGESLSHIPGRESDALAAVRKCIALEPEEDLLKEAKRLGKKLKKRIKAAAGDEL